MSTLRVEGGASLIGLGVSAMVSVLVVPHNCTGFVDVCIVSYVWFVCMLVVYYLLYIIHRIASRKKNNKKKIGGTTMYYVNN